MFPCIPTGEKDSEELVTVAAGTAGHNIVEHRGWDWHWWIPPGGEGGAHVGDIVPTQGGEG